MSANKSSPVDHDVECESYAAQGPRLPVLACRCVERATTTPARVERQTDTHGIGSYPGVLEARYVG